MGTYRVAPMDRAALIVTAYFYILTAAFVVSGLIWPDARLMIAVAGFLIVIAWFCRQIAPKSYEVTDDEVVIRRGWPFSDIRIPSRDIREVRRVTLSPWTTVRTFGVGGLYGYSGRFRSRDIGAYYGAITDSKRTVLIAANGSYVISPEDPEQFVADMQSRISRSRL